MMKEGTIYILELYNYYVQIICFAFAIIFFGCSNDTYVVSIRTKSHLEKLDALGSLEVEEVGRLVTEILPYKQVETKQLLRNANTYQYNHNLDHSIMLYNVYSDFEVIEWRVDTTGYGKTLKDSLLSLDDYNLVRTKFNPDRIETYRSKSGNIIYRFEDYRIDDFVYPSMFQFIHSD